MYFAEFSIYTLVDPENGNVRYVGLSKDVKQRFYSHCFTFNTKSPSPVSLWAKGLKDRGLLPLFYVIEEGLHSYAAWEREAYWIDFFLAEEEPLLNRVLPRKEKLLIRR